MILGGSSNEYTISRATDVNFGYAYYIKDDRQGSPDGLDTLYNIGSLEFKDGVIEPPPDEKPVFVNQSLKTSHLDQRYSSELSGTSNDQLKSVVLNGGTINYGPSSSTGTYGNLQVSNDGSTSYTENPTALAATNANNLEDNFSVTATKGNATTTDTYSVTTSNSAAANSLVIQATGEGSIDGIAYGSNSGTSPYKSTKLQTVNLQGGNDTATLSDAAGTNSSLTLDGSTGEDTLVANSSNNLLTLTGENQGTLDQVNFSNIENVSLGGGDDSVVIQAGGKLTGLLDGGAGSNTLTAPDGTPISIGNGGGSIGGINFTGFNNVRGGGVGTNNIEANDQANIVNITGAGSGSIDGTSFANIQAIDLKGGNDTATVGAAGSLTGLLNGGSGTDILNANASANSLIINASAAGKVDSTTISNFETINTLDGNDSITVNNSATALALNAGNGTDSLTSTTTADILNVSGTNSGTLGSIAFSNLENVTLGAGNDTATIATGGSLTALSAGAGTDTLNANGSANVTTINSSSSGTVDGTSMSSFERIDLKGGADKATVDLLNPATTAKSLFLDGGEGLDALDIKISEQDFGKLQNTDALTRLSSYLSDPTGKSLDIAFGDFSLSATGFESATFNHVINPPRIKPQAAPTLNSVAAYASDTASASGLEGLKLDVGGAANVQAPVTLKSTSDASTVEGNVKSDARATEVLGISASTLHSASDLSVGSALQSMVTGSAESTSGIAIANALVDTQQGIDLTNPIGGDALASGGSSTVISTSTLTATSIAQTVGDGRSDSGALLLDGAWANTIAQDHLGLGSSAPTGVLTLDSESNATVSTSMLSKLSSTATANDGLAVATSQLMGSTGIENLIAEVGGKGLVTSINQGVFHADATSTTDDASALGTNKASAGILDSTFTFGITDSTITAKDFNSLQVSATSTGGDAWSKLQSSSTGIADLNGIENRITDAGSISAIASDQGFAHSATVSGSATALASQEAVGMSGYDVHNHSGLTLSAQALVISESNSSAVGG